MTWTDLAPAPLNCVQTARRAVTVACRVPKARGRPGIAITVRAGLLDGKLPWWTQGAMVKVQLGAGEHADMVRLSPGGTLKIVAFGRAHGAPGIGSIRIPFPPSGGPAVARPPVPVEFDHGDGWLELTLPDWARAAPPALSAAPAIGAASVKPSTSGFSMLGGSVSGAGRAQTGIR